MLGRIELRLRQTAAAVISLYPERYPKLPTELAGPTGGGPPSTDPSSRCRNERIGDEDGRCSNEYLPLCSQGTTAAIPVIATPVTAIRPVRSPWRWPLPI